MKDVNMIIFHQCCLNPEIKVYIQKNSVLSDITWLHVIIHPRKCDEMLLPSHLWQPWKSANPSWTWQQWYVPVWGSRYFKHWNPNIPSWSLEFHKKKVVNITRNTQTLHDWHHGFFVEKPVVFTCFHQFLSISTSWSLEFLCRIDFVAMTSHNQAAFSFQPTLWAHHDKGTAENASTESTWKKSRKLWTWL